jgi:hypothetical protein
MFMARRLSFCQSFTQGAATEGRRLIDELRSLGNPHSEHVGAQPYADWQKAFGPLLTAGARNYWKSHNFTELSDVPSM